MAPVESAPAYFARLIPVHSLLVRVARVLLFALGPLAVVPAALPARAQVPPPDSTRPPRPVADSAARARRDSLRVDSVRADSSRLRLGPAQQSDSTLNLDLVGRLEMKGERTRNDRCFANQFFGSTLRCSSPLTPQFDFQFGLLSSGTVADRVRVNVDYDSQREFDGSNNISIAYEGRPGELFQRIEAGNVSFDVPSSRYITSGIPSGNYGVQATGQVGALRFSAIAATQKGNVVRDQIFTVGATTAQAVSVEIPDYRLEPRRFFFTVDPVLFGSRYPNIDILDPRQMSELAGLLPDTLRPARVRLYRLVIGGQPPNPNGPRFTLIGEPVRPSGQVYELLREGVDYYIDPSLLWFALVRPLSLANERLVAAWTLRLNGRDTTIAHLGGTPDLEFTLGQQQFAHLIWDPNVSPDDDAFRREIRSVYRLGGSDLRRETVSLRLVSGTGDQEKAPGINTNYLELFGLAKPTGRAEFDVENRLWPRPNDPNILISAPPGTDAATLIRDVFVVFPSLEPFSRRGLASAPNVVANDTLYRTPGEYLYSQRHPQSFYRLLARYDTEASAGTGVITLAAVQIRPGSERLTLDGRPLVRGVDYEIDYDVGRVQLLTPDTLSLRPRRVAVQYEENPLFSTVPTTVTGLTTELALPFGSVSLIALSQRQRTNFTRPALGYEPQASLVAGLGANLGWNLGRVSRWLAGRLSRADSAAPSRLDVQAEVAVSRPQQPGGQQAYIDSFEGEGGITVNLLEANWQLSSQPALGVQLATRVGAATLDTTRAATLAYQNHGSDINDRPVTFSIQQIDPRTRLPGGAVAGFEQMLWLSLYPLRVGGLRDPSSGQYQWTIPDVPAGRRWRSVRTALGPSGQGVDLTTGEHLEFWTLIDTSLVRRGRNPVLVFDLGDVSENSVAYAPQVLRITGTDSAWVGRRLQGFDRLDTERDRFSRAFSADVNDLGLPGDVADTLRVFRDGIPIAASNFPVCQLAIGRLLPLGDARINCTRRNNRLDEEDIDQDAVLNFTSAERELERVRRFIVDLSDSTIYNRVGTCDVRISDVNNSHPAGSELCWVQVRIPFNAPDEEIAGGPELRRVRAMRVTVISGSNAPDNHFTLIPLARLRVSGAHWLKRAARPLRGLGGEEQTVSGFVIATQIGTQDRDSTRGLNYEPPPGVSDEAETTQTPIGVVASPINERSMRLLAGDLPLNARAETYLRFPEGERSVMTYRELRLWARGRGRGWGPGGDLEFFIKLGRDANNFYVYRTPVYAGPTRISWEPEIRVQFSRFYALRARLENAFLRGETGLHGCTARDSALILASGLPPNVRATHNAACDGGYIVYSVDPAVTPPNLAAVQELAAGIVRVDSMAGADPPLPGDTLEVWINDIRLAETERQVGYAGFVGVTFTAGDVASIRVLASRRDPNFRQLGEPPSFLTNDDAEISTTWRLDKILPWHLGLVVPLTVSHSIASTDPFFLTNADIRGDAVENLRTPRQSNTSVSLSLRRATPLTGTWWAPIVNNVGLTLNWNGTGSRSEYRTVRRRGLDLGMDFLYANDATPSPEPGRFNALGEAQGQVPAPAGLALEPSLVRVSSAYVRASDRVNAFVAPGVGVGDGPHSSLADQQLWRNATSVEFRPASTITARWDFASTRDLRNYGDGSPNGVAAGQERVHFAGVDLGLERERNVGATLLYTPAGPEAWLRPRAEWTSGYSLLRDPNAPAVSDPRNDDVLRLARRFGNSQRATLAAVVDLPAAVEGRADSGSFLHSLATALGAIDVSLSRDQITAYDAAPLTPSLAYQFGFGGIDAFREIRDVLAASAGAGTQLMATNTLTLPFGATISQRAQRTTSRHWSRRLQERETVIDGVQTVYPDLTMRWTGQPVFLDQLLSSVAATARVAHSRQSFLSPPDVFGNPAELRTTRLRTYPFSLTAVSADGDLALTASFTRAERLDSLPGSAGESRTTEMSADLARTFPLPASWEFRSGLRARISYAVAGTKSYVSNVAAVGARSRLTDNGSRRFSISADTDLAEDLTFSLQGSRVVTFDRNFNRRFTQTLISAVLNIQFFGGAPRANSR